MNDRELRDLLGPDDDGRGFTEAVLLRAAGALHRRRAVAAASVPAFGWLEQWARPWLVAALLLVALGALAPALPWRETPQTLAAAPADSDAMVASLLPADVAVAVANER
ncbi:MAG: hypothetical protein ACHQU1_10280 [Gemmatimonadales bacterium]